MSIASPPTQRPANTNAAPQPRSHRTLIVVIIVVVLSLGGVWWLNHRHAAEGGTTGAAKGEGGGGRRGGRGFGGSGAPLPVGIRAAEKGDLRVYLSALGSVVAGHAATLRTQISGQLMRVAFEEGQLVREGDLLAEIDPRPYQNALAQAEAQLQQAQAQLSTAKDNLSRYEKLAKEDSIAQQQVDTTRSQVSQFEGLVQAGLAAIATAKLNINYCSIKAPFAGRVGMRQVDSGNYVTPGDPNGLVALAQVKPITVIFTLPEDNITQVATHFRGDTKLAVTAYDRTQTKQLATGTLITIDNQIDPTTGTFKLRAEFPNDDESLVPNQFVNVRLLLETLHEVTIVPTSAIERGAEGAYVYLVDENSAAIARPVKLGVTEGERIQILDGLAAGDKVVTDGADKLKDGQKVILNAAEGGRGGGKGGKGSGEGKRGGGGGGGEKKKRPTPSEKT